MNDNNSLQTNDYYKNLNKHGNCSKCNNVLTLDNYKKVRTVCKVCYNNRVLEYYKKKCSNSSLKTDVGTQTDFLDELDSSNKQVRSRKQNRSRKQVTSSKQDASINLKNIDPDCLMEKFLELYNNKYDSIEQSQAARENAKEILDEL